MTVNLSTRAGSNNLFKGSLRLIGTSLALPMIAGICLALPLSQIWPQQWRAEALISAGNEAVTRDQAARISHLVKTEAQLDRVIDDLGPQKSMDLTLGKSTTFSMVFDLAFGRNATLAERNASVRTRLSEMVAVGVDIDHVGLKIQLTAHEAAAAATLANAVAGQLIAQINKTGLPSAASELETLRRTAQSAEDTLDRARRDLGQEQVADLRLADSEAQALGRQISAMESRIAEIDARRKRVEGMSLEDVLAHALPDSLDFTALDYRRQRYIEARLTRDQLASQLGPLHPRLQAAEGDLEEAGREIVVALRKLGTNLDAQREAISSQISTLKDRRVSKMETVARSGSKLEELEAAATAARARYAAANNEQSGGSKGFVSRFELANEAVAENAIAIGLTKAEFLQLGALAGFMVGLAVISLHLRATYRTERKSEPAVDWAEAHTDTVEVLPDIVTLLSDEIDPDLHWEHQPHMDIEQVAQSFEIPCGHEDRPLVEQIREILSRNAVQAEDQQSLPPLVAAILAGDSVLYHADTEQSTGTESELLAANDDPQFMRDIDELKREMADLRGRVNHYASLRRAV